MLHRHGRIVVETNMGAISTVMAYGSEEQKRLAAELVLSGDKPAICITEPDAGSDATGMTTRADKRGDRYVINGRKHWITGGGVSRLHLIFARVFDEKGDELGIGGFLAVRDEAKGLRIAQARADDGVARHARGRARVRESRSARRHGGACRRRLPARLCRPDDRLQQPARRRRHRGAGHRGRRARSCVDWSKKREQFGRPIGEFQGLQWMLADMPIQLTALAADALSGGALARRGLGFPRSDAGRAGQDLRREAAIQIVNDALQMFGARGYSRELPLERMARDVRMFTIGGGTAQVLRTLVAVAHARLEAAADARRLRRGRCAPARSRATARAALHRPHGRS